MKLNEILHKEDIAEKITKIELYQPWVVKKCQAGQFVIIRAKDYSERIPLTVNKVNKEKKTITIIFQQVGKSTEEMATFNVGDAFLDVCGPLGKPSEIEKYGTVVCIGGGVGTAVMYPITVALKKAGNKIISIVGARNKDLLILENAMRDASDEIIITTDDGSYGKKGLVTDALKEIIERGEKIDLVYAIGPVIMMKFVCKLTKEYNLKTMVSLNPIMLDATGMCGVCRVEIDGKTKFACVDGPDFDGHKVNFKQLLERLDVYKKEEKDSLDRFHKCQHSQ